MNARVDFTALREELARTGATRAEGRVEGVTGLAITATLPGARMGDLVTVGRRGAPLLAEVSGFHGGRVTLLPLGDTAGVGAEDPVESTGGPLEIRVGDALFGRVLDGLGRPLDDGGPVSGRATPVAGNPPAPLRRTAVEEALPTSVRAIDGLLTLGVGQRVGLFSGSGVGKSTLLGALARGASADAVVVALVGERGREVRDFVERILPAARERAVFVVATSDAPAVERIRAAEVATTVAESFRDEGRRVLLLVDSITRVARAQREVGLASGEPPARRGFPPSVFAMLPRLLERAGQGERGSITALYTVLVEGDDLDEPVTDEVRGILDGHVVLSRRLASEHHHPAIDVPASLSRVMPRVVSARHADAAGRIRALLAAYEDKRELVTLGAYQAGGDPRLDRALRALPDLRRFLVQAEGEVAPFDATVEALVGLAERHGSAP
ncbi:MAG TPA: FliI/YscN family ATPase [Polyangiaceae bacterium]|nr:FliI/YscN family ATPase [Polyangiaceae bacterium]